VRYIVYSTALLAKKSARRVIFIKKDAFDSVNLTLCAGLSNPIDRTPVNMDIIPYYELNTKEKRNE